MNAGPRLPELFRLFRADAPLPDFEIVPADAVPEPYHNLLVHPHHMTVTVEAYYGGAVDVQVLARRTDDDTYSRKILLIHRDSGRVVQFGLVRIHLNMCSPAVRAAILEEKTPLGRVLIDHDVMRRIELTAYFRVDTGPALTEWFGLAATARTYGRLGYIYCDHQPAIELLEILAPVHAD